MASSLDSFAYCVGSYRFSIFVHEKTKAEFLKENSNRPDRMKAIEEIAKPARLALAEMEERRFIKTHLPFSLLPPNLLETGCKVRTMFFSKFA